MSFTSFFDDPFSSIGSLFSGGSPAPDLSGLDLSQTAPSPATSGITDGFSFNAPITGDPNAGPENFTAENAAAFNSGMPGDGSVGSLVGVAAKAAAKTLGGITGSGLMSPTAGPPRVENFRQFQDNRMANPKPVEKSRPAAVANADEIMMHWIQRMRVFSGIFGQGKYTV